MTIQEVHNKIRFGLQEKSNSNTGKFTDQQIDDVFNEQTNEYIKDNVVDEETNMVKRNLKNNIDIKNLLVKNKKLTTYVPLNSDYF